MDTYSLTRLIADSWVLLVLFLFFLSVGAWAFWPSLAKSREEASMIPFRDEDPAGPRAEPVKETKNG